MSDLRVEGYGVRPKDALRRAATVRAVTASDATPERPLLWVVICGLVAVVSLLYLIHALASWWSGSMPGAEATLRFMVFGALYGFGVWGFSYGWELYDVRKASRLAIVLGVFGLAILIVGALILVVLAKASDDLDLDIDLGSLGRGARSAAKGAGSLAIDAADIVAPAIAQAYSENVRPPWLPPEQAASPEDIRQPLPPGTSSLVDTPRAAPPGLPADDPRGIDCPGCGQRFDPTDRLGCPACGRPI